MILSGRMIVPEPKNREMRCRATPQRDKLTQLQISKELTTHSPRPGTPLHGVTIIAQSTCRRIFARLRSILRATYRPPLVHPPGSSMCFSSGIGCLTGKLELTPKNPPSGKQRSRTKSAVFRALRRGASWRRANRTTLAGHCARLVSAACRRRTRASKQTRGSRERNPTAIQMRIMLT